MQPKKIGLTGGIGTGKTTVSKIFQALDIPIFNSDNVSKLLLQKHPDIIREITDTIDQNLIKNNQIDTVKLAKIVFSNKGKLKLLNKIIHPHVSKYFDTWIQQQNSKYIIKESAILFESNTYKNLDKIILIRSPLILRINRVCQRDNRTKEDVKNIIKNQVEEKEIIQDIDYIIHNNEEKLLTPQVIELDEKLKNL